jgi:hypothetical protein
MHPRLTDILAHQHIADLRRSADQHRLLHRATPAMPRRLRTTVLTIAAVPFSFLRWLRRRLPRSQRGRLKPSEVQAGGCR